MKIAVYDAERMQPVKRSRSISHKNWHQSDNTKVAQKRSKHRCRFFKWL